MSKKVNLTVSLKGDNSCDFQADGQHRGDDR